MSAPDRCAVLQDRTCERYCCQSFGLSCIWPAVPVWNASSCAVEQRLDSPSVFVTGAGNEPNGLAGTASQPPVFLIGAMKCGTTALADALLSHPYIHSATPPAGRPRIAAKEVHYFDNTCTNESSRQQYERLFDANLPLGHVNLDATPVYLYIPPVAELVHGMYGKNVKILVVLRDPVERAVSHWR